MPEPGQKTLSRQLTTLVEEVLRRWTGPLPRLAYITDGGYHQTWYYRQVSARMSDPRHPGERLKWASVIDYYHPYEYSYKMADALFPTCGGMDVRPAAASGLQLTACPLETHRL